jgi:glutathione-regulated potassium-efflux system ancillary protein KefG
VIVFQHPLYTYSCPALLKEWLDRVLSRGFSSGVGEPAGGKVLA